MAVVGIFERGYISASGDLAPSSNELTGTFALSGISGQNFAMALLSWTFAHVQFASFEIILWIHMFGAW